MTVPQYLKLTGLPQFHHNTMLCLVCYSIKNNFFLHEFSCLGRWAAKLLVRLPAPAAFWKDKNYKIIVAKNTLAQKKNNK